MPDCWCRRRSTPTLTHLSAWTCRRQPAASRTGSAFHKTIAGAALPDTPTHTHVGRLLWVSTGDRQNRSRAPGVDSGLLLQHPEGVWRAAMTHGTLVPVIHVFPPR